MKKGLKLIIGAMVILPLSVKADMGAPSIKEYKATPKSADGAPIYNMYNEKVEGKFDYNEILTVSMEEESHSKVYAFACNKSNKCGNVLIDDLKLSKAADTSEYTAIYKGRVFAKNGVEVYEGPGYIYERVGKKIPADADVVVSGYDQDEGTWLKVKYKDIEGFVDSSKAAVMILYSGEQLIMSTNKIINEFYKSNDWDRKIAYKENGKYVIENEFYEYSGEYKTNSVKYKALKDMPLYKTYLVGSTGEEVGTVKKGDTVKFIYNASYQGSADYYVEVNGVKGWIDFSYDEGDKYLEGYDYENLPDVDNAWETREPVKADSEDIDPSSKDVTDPKVDDKKPSKKSFFSKWDKDTIILVSIVAGAAIVLSSIVTLILVNKKNKKKNSVQE